VFGGAGVPVTAPEVSYRTATVVGMALHIHRAERTDALADGLGALLATPQPDPFATELVLVSARGMERWLSQRLSHRLGIGSGTDGVCAGIEFRAPTSLISELAGYPDGVGDPWSPGAMTWRLLEVIDAHLDEGWCRTLATHLGHFATGEERELRLGRRYAVASRLSGLFSAYARQRPALLSDWLAGETGELAPDLHWQPPLFRALVAAGGIDPPSALHAQTVARLEARGADFLPQRLSLFGHTRLAQADIDLLAALSVHHDLHLWLPHPSAALWSDLAGQHGVVARRADTSHRLVGHPLLATLGRDLRELQRTLPTSPATDEPLACESQYPDTLLGWLVSDIAANRVRPTGRRLDPDDRSVQVHSCHGPARQVDVLREILLGLLADDPTLEPRDILVMCPDIETYAPLIVAGFGLGDVVVGAHPAHRLRVRLADRSLVQTNPLLGIAARLLELADSRATASEVLDLAHAAPVRARFGFTDDDLESVTRWVRQANIRWGFDQQHRMPFGVDFVHNTWQFGLDRVLAGVAMSDDSNAWIDSTLPLDDVGSNRVELAGRLTEYFTSLRAVVDSLTGAKQLGEWMSALSDGVERLTAFAGDDAWQSSQMYREFNEIIAESDGTAAALRLADIRAVLSRALAGRPTRANFRTGTLTVCTMIPMRSVPHRVVCVIGLDDDSFPRLSIVDGDDALARSPMTGERDIRSEDRQLLLDAIGAATENLVITYTGANEFSGQPRPPAVPLAELLDALDQTTPWPVRNQVLTQHPLQPFDIRNVEVGALIPDRPFSFDRTARMAAAALAGERSDRPPFAARPLPAPTVDDVSLADLRAFFKDPVRGFFRALDYTLPWEVDGVVDEMPVEIDALAEWTVGDQMLSDMMRGLTPDDARQAEWRRGTVPPGNLGWRKVTEIRDRAAPLAQEARGWRQVAARAIDVDVDLGDGRRLAGTVAPIFGERLVSVTYSKLDGKHLLEPWIDLLALYAHDSRREWSAVCIGRPKRGESPCIKGISRPEDSALQLLRDLVTIFDAGRREPIPLPIKTSHAWAVARHAGNDPERAAQSRWRSGRYPGEDQRPAHVQAWGSKAPLSTLLQPVRPGEESDGESSRLGAYSARLWLPLLRSERGLT
jgi:exodeoxyribonuclease V gamma subunit